MEKEIYEISDLSGESLDRAIEAIKENPKFHNRDVDLDWLVDSLQEDLKENGFDSAEISFSGFWSQGDGASFVGKVDDKEKFFETIGISVSEIHPRVWEFIEENLDMSIVRHSSRYVHEGTVSVDWEFYDDPVVQMFPSSLEFGDITINVEEFLASEGLWSKGTAWKNSKCKEIYRTIEKAYEEEFSDEAAIDWADQMGIEFDEKGNEI